MADNNNILDKLDGLVARFEEISTLITDPSVIADQKRYVKLTKEYKELDDLMNARKEYMQLQANITEAREILANESDAEMREMAKEELDIAVKNTTNGLFSAGLAPGSNKLMPV